MTITHDNFFRDTFAKYKKCKVPKRVPDFVSRNHSGVSSCYWYGEDQKKGPYVIRYSDHWGNVGYCRWLLNGSTENFTQPIGGKAYLREFKKI